jgi:uncharacterized glyoxalase superfamily protein PhnB
MARSEPVQSVFPTLRISSYEAAREFYVRGLGFAVDWEWRHEPGFPVFMQVSRGGLAFYLSEHEGDCKPGGCVHLYVSDVDDWCARATAAGLPVKQPPTDQAWGNRDMVLVDPFGNRLVIAQRKPPLEAA